MSVMQKQLSQPWESSGKPELLQITNEVERLPTGPVLLLEVVSLSEASDECQVAPFKVLTFSMEGGETSFHAHTRKRGRYAEGPINH